MKIFYSEKISVLGLVLCLSVLSLGCIDFSGGEPDTDEIKIIGEEKSPNGKFIATSFSCSGRGAAGYFYFNASLRKAGEKLDQRDGLLGKHKTWKAFANIEVKWIDDENLEVSYSQSNSPDYKENNAVKVESKHGIKIHHNIRKKAKKAETPKIDKRIMALLGGKSVYALIANLSKAKTCEAYRIDGYSRGAKEDKRGKMRGYPIISGPTPIDDASKVSLSNVIIDSNTYLWDVAKSCEFLPGVALHLADANVQVDILICFSCDELEIYTNGKRAGHEDFDLQRSNLLRVAKKLFPKDEKIQALK